MGTPVIYVLWSKNTNPKSPALEIFHPYASTNYLIDLGITSDRNRMSSGYLKESIYTLGEWISNNYLPWAAYQAIVSVKLNGLEKFPGFHTVGIRDILQIILRNWVLKACDEDFTYACGVDHLCLGLRGRIERSSMWLFPLGGTPIWCGVGGIYSRCEKYFQWYQMDRHVVSHATHMAIWQPVQLQCTLELEIAGNERLFWYFSQKGGVHTGWPPCHDTLRPRSSTNNAVPQTLCGGH